MISNTVSVSELLRLAVSLAGFFYAAKLTWTSHQDVEWLKKARINGLRRYSARTSNYFFLAVTIAMFGFIATAIIAMTLNTPESTWRANLTQGIYACIAIVLTFFCWLKALRRDRLIKKLEGVDISENFSTNVTSN